MGSGTDTCTFYAAQRSCSKGKCVGECDLGGAPAFLEFTGQLIYRFKGCAEWPLEGHLHVFRCRVQTSIIGVREGHLRVLHSTA
eukprot:scaffold6826_cov17-Tisochrysis_lutea.AAC.2